MQTLLIVVEKDDSFAKANLEITEKDPDPEKAKALLKKHELKTDKTCDDCKSNSKTVGSI